MTEREDGLAWRERVLEEKEHELNRIEQTLGVERTSFTHVVSGVEPVNYLEPRRRTLHVIA